jgi:transposase
MEAVAQKAGSVRAGEDDSGMAQNFLGCDREQELLLPPSLRERLPEDHLVWFVIDAVAAMDLEAFYAAYRVDGWGRAAHEPMMVALLLYAYATGERSSRRVERRCIDDVATRVICANQRPDHTTIARFRQRHEAALADLFGEVLGLCADAGLVRVGVVAIDGTKVHANASNHATRSYEDIAREILAEADAVDAAEDEQFGAARGDELPPELATSQGRRGWLRDARRRLDERRAEEARSIPKSRPDRLKESKRRLEEEHAVECRANADYEAYRARGRMKDGRRFGRPPNAFEPPEVPVGKINVSDPDSRNVKTTRGWIQGYNAQAAVSEDQIVVAAEITVDSPDFGHLQPMIQATRTELAAAGIQAKPEIVLADSGYCLSRPDGPRRRRRPAGADSARRQQTIGRPAGLGRRPLRLHALGAGHRARRRPLPPPPDDDRAGLRPHQVQPPDGPVPAPRQSRRTVGMAAHHRHPQSAQALPPHQRPRSGLNRRATALGGRRARFRRNAFTKPPPRKRPAPFVQQPPCDAAAVLSSPRRGRPPPRRRSWSAR